MKKKKPSAGRAFLSDSPGSASYGSSAHWEIDEDGYAGLWIADGQGVISIVVEPEAGPVAVITLRDLINEFLKAYANQATKK